MKKSDERLSAWIDGEMSEAEREAFEREAGPALAEFRRDRDEAVRVGNLIRHAPVPPLRNPDFFNHQLLERIRVEEPEPAPKRPSRFRWALPVSLSFAAALVVVLVTVFNSQPEEYETRVFAATVPETTISAVAFHAPDSKLTVIWMDGLEYLPADYPVN